MIGRPIFPPGKVRKSDIGELSLYTDRTVIVLPVEADKEIEAKQLRISGVTTYQSCDDKTLSCQPPTAAEWELTLPVAGPNEKVTAAHPELFAASATPTASAPSSRPARSDAASTTADGIDFGQWRGWRGGRGTGSADSSFLQRIEDFFARLGDRWVLCDGIYWRSDSQPDALRSPGDLDQDSVLRAAGEREPVPCFHTRSSLSRPAFWFRSPPRASLIVGLGQQWGRPVPAPADHHRLGRDRDRVLP